MAPDPPYNDFNSSPVHSSNLITQQLPNHGKLCASMGAIHNGGLERAGSSGNLSLGEDSPTWRGKKTPSGGGSTGNLSSSCSLKDITEEAINLASGKLKEFSFDKLRLSSSSHVTLRKGRKVRPDSFSRRSTDLEIIYGHFSANSTTTTNISNNLGTSNDENTPPFVLGKGTGLEETKLNGNSATLSTVNKASGGSTSSLSSFGSLDQSLNTVASLYRTTLGEENLIARLLEKTRAEAASGGGEDIRACLDILLKCSEDLKKCTDIIKQCIKRKAGGGPEEGGASPDSVYRAVMTRLSSYLKRLPLELEGLGSLGGSGQGVQGAPGGGHSDLAELVNTLHSIQQGPYSPIFGNEQPPRYEDVVQSPPIPKSVAVSSTTKSIKSDSVQKAAVQSKDTPLTNGLQHTPNVSVPQNTLSPPPITYSPCNSSPSHSPLRNSPIPPYTHTPPASPMEALFIEEEEAEMGKTSDNPLQQMHSPSRGLNNTPSKNGTMLGQQLQPHTPYISSKPMAAISGYIPSWPSAATVPTNKASSQKNEDIDKLLMDLENLSQSMSHPRNTEPPLPVKTRKREGNKAISNDSFTQPKLAQFQIPNPTSQLSMNGLIPVTSQSLTPPQGDISEPVTEEEDGALLLRILESIESFAQELVDSGAGGTGSVERKCGKEKEVMRLLQDTLVPSSRADTPLESINTTAASTTPSIPTIEVSSMVTKEGETNAPAAIPVPVESEGKWSAAEEAIPVPEKAPQLLPAFTQGADRVAEDPTDEFHAAPSEAANVRLNTQVEEAPPAVLPEVSVPDPIPTEEAIREIPVGEPGAASTLLIQQTPEVIRVSQTLKHTFK